ncbi:MAG: YceD family protein, partial [Limnobacter sp.]|nr:YceD family protein [Limnobacter sp.]
DLGRFDLWEFCRTGGQLASTQANLQFDRLMSDPNVSCVHHVDWAMLGFMSRRHESTVQIKGTMRIDLICAHCQGEYSDTIPIHRNWVLMRSEQAAEDYDEDNLGEHDDVVACEGYIDLKQWVEDELLLSLPMLPAHPDQCVQNWLDSASEQGELDDAPEVNNDPDKPETHKPFADLDQLIKSKNN